MSSKTKKEDRVRLRMLYVGVVSRRDNSKRSRSYRYIVLHPVEGDSYDQGHKCPWKCGGCKNGYMDVSMADTLKQERTECPDCNGTGYRDDLEWLDDCDFCAWGKKLLKHGDPGAVFEIEASHMPKPGNTDDLSIWHNSDKFVESIPHELRSLLMMNHREQQTYHDKWLEGKKQAKADDPELEEALTTIAQRCARLRTFESKQAFIGYVTGQLWVRDTKSGKPRKGKR